MKKIYSNKKGKRTGVKLSCSNKAKHRRSYKAVQIMTVGKPGPSKAIKYSEDGKVTGFVKWADKKQSKYTTKIAKTAMDENKSIKQSKKDLVKSILIKAGYDPTIRYTRKEKRKFTRIVKNNLFTKPKSVTLTTEQIKEKIKADKLAKKEMQAKFEESVRNNPLPVVPGKQRGATAAELSVKEKPKLRKFTYAIQRYRDVGKDASDIDKHRTYDFATSYIDAKTKDEAFKALVKEAKKYKKDTSFAGIKLHDKEGDNTIIYYSKEKLNAA